jgi:heme exporter protein D
MLNFAFENINDFLQMGKHGFYVWLCYGLTLLVVVANIVLYRFKKQSIINNIQAEQVRKQKQQENFN